MTETKSVGGIGLGTVELAAEKVDFAKSLKGSLLVDSLDRIFLVSGYHGEYRASTGKMDLVIEMTVLHPGRFRPGNKGDIKEYYVSLFSSGNCKQVIPGTEVPDNDEFENYSVSKAEENKLPWYAKKFRKRLNNGHYDI